MEWTGFVKHRFLKGVFAGQKSMLYKSSSVHSTPMQSIFNKIPIFQGEFSQLIAVLSTLIVNSDSQNL